MELSSKQAHLPKDGSSGGVPLLCKSIKKTREKIIVHLKINTESNFSSSSSCWDTWCVCVCPGPYHKYTASRQKALPSSKDDKSHYLVCVLRNIKQSSVCVSAKFGYSSRWDKRPISKNGKMATEVGTCLHTYRQTCYRWAVSSQFEPREEERSLAPGLRPRIPTRYSQWWDSPVLSVPLQLASVNVDLRWDRKLDRRPIVSDYWRSSMHRSLPSCVPQICKRARGTSNACQY